MALDYGSCEAKNVNCTETPLQSELRQLKREITNTEENILRQREFLRIARAKFAAVKKLA